MHNRRQQHHNITMLNDAHSVPIKTISFLVMTYADVDRISNFFHQQIPKKTMYLWHLTFTMLQH